MIKLKRRNLLLFLGGSAGAIALTNLGNLYSGNAEEKGAILVDAHYAVNPVSLSGPVQAPMLHLNRVLLPFNLTASISIIDNNYQECKTEPKSKYE
jgi:hypothetical protein